MTRPTCHPIMKIRIPVQEATAVGYKRMLVKYREIDRQHRRVYTVTLFFDFSLTVKAAPHECVIRTGQP